MVVSDIQKDYIDINKTVLSRIGTLARRNRLAHAYLFVGPSDVGKSATAIAVAKLLNCEYVRDNKEDMFCNNCPSCKKIDSGNHPDVHWLISGFGDTIKIDDVRTILSQSRLRPFQSDRKIFIITNIENLSQESGNALLKTLEEPSKSSLLLLTSSMPARIMATVKSRCQIIYFYPLSIGALALRLKACYDMGDDINFIAHFADGCLGKAKRFKEIDIFKIKNEVIDTFILSYNSDTLIDNVCKDKQKAKEFFDILLSWIRDCLLIKTGVGEDGDNFVNLDRIHDIKRFQERFSFSELEEIGLYIINLRRLLSENLNLKVPIWFLREKIWGR